MNEHGQIVRNKTRLVCKDYSQVEGIDYEEKYSPLARWKEINIFWPLLLIMISKYTKWR